jgi:hypothetical protein
MDSGNQALVICKVAKASKPLFFEHLLKFPFTCRMWPGYHLLSKSLQFRTTLTQFAAANSVSESIDPAGYLISNVLCSIIECISRYIIIQLPFAQSCDILVLHIF